MKEKKDRLVRKSKALKISKTVQESIPYEFVYPDNGIIETEKGVFCRAYSFGDINWACAKEEEQISFFTSFCALLNSFDAMTNFQILVNNHTLDIQEFERNAMMPVKNDGLDELRSEYNEILRDRIRSGCNSLRSDRYLIVSIEAESAAAASNQFVRMDTQIVSLVNKIGKAECKALNSTDLLRVLYDIYNRGDEEAFGAKTQLDNLGRKSFDFTNLHRLGLTTKDAIGPQSMQFKPSYFILGENNFGRAEYVNALPSQLSTEFYIELTSLGFTMLSAVHYMPLPQEDALRKTRNKLISANANVVDAQKKAARYGYSGELISENLKLASREANELLADLQIRDQKLFEVSIVFCHFANSMEELNQQTELIRSTARKNLVTVNTLTFQQENGFAAALPLARNELSVKRTLTTETAAVFMPFRCQELSEEKGICYGTNAISQNLISVDRRNLTNPSGWLFGVPGSGKSFAAKTELISVILNSDAEVIIVDPEREYTPLLYRLNKMSTVGDIARIEHISVSNKDTYINPLELPPYDASSDTDPISDLLPYVLGLCQNMYSATYPMPQGCDSLVDRALHDIFASYLPGYLAGHPDPRLMPTLRNLQQQLMRYNEAAARELALSMEVFCSGSLDLFAHQTTTVKADVQHPRITVYDIADTGATLLPIAMAVATHQVWNKLVENRLKGKNTYMYFDEISLLFNDSNSAEFLKMLYKRARKYGGVATSLTQNIEDLLTNPTVRTMLSNAEFLVMLNQSALDKGALAQLLDLSETQLGFVSDCEPGSGLLRCGKAMVPFTNQIPPETKLFRLMNTNLKNMSNEELEEMAEILKNT